jgi:tetratricopeptide (TPR) repeat protein
LTEEQKQKQESFEKAHDTFNKALQSFEEGNYSEAESLFTEAIGLCKNSTGIETPAYGFTIHNLGETQIKLDKWEEAEASFLEAIRVRTRLPQTSGTRYTMAMSRDSLAQIYEKRGDHKKARGSRTVDPENMICSFTKVS